MTVIARARVILGIVLTQAIAVLAFSKYCYQQLLLNAAKFPNLPIPIANFKAQIDDLDASQVAMGTGAKGLNAARRAKSDFVSSTLELYRAYIQSLCDLLPRAEALALAQSAGMSIAAIGRPTKALLQAMAGPHANSVTVKANATLLTAGMRGAVTFNWRFSAAGAAWVSAKSTSGPAVTIENLTPNTDYAFQVSASTRTVDGAWTDAVHHTFH